MSQKKGETGQLADGGVTVIAEIGVNHNGSLESAQRLVDACSDAGADLAKFQTFRASDLASVDAPLADYQKTSSGSRGQRDLLASLELSQEQFLELRDYCHERNIGFLTTAHDFTSAEFVMDLKSDFIKVPSGDLTNLPFLQLVGRQGAPVLLSTGASDLAEVGEAINVLESAGLARSHLTIMQCTTEYPAPASEANLLAMVEMGKRWGVAIGFSDHTAGDTAAIAAVALGATVLEKHITLDRSMTGPDHAASLEPSEFSRLVASVRRVRELRGESEKAVTPSEEKNRDVVRKSIVASRRIRTGDLLHDGHLGVTRPGTGVSPMRWPEVVGTRAHRGYLPGEMIELI